MTYADLSVAPATPEIFLLAAACALLLIDLVVPQDRRALTFYLSAGVLVACAAMSIGDINLPARAAFNGLYEASPLAGLLKATLFLSMAVSLCYSRSYLAERGMLSGEYNALSLFAALGMAVLVSANHMLTVYLGLELMSLALYAMVAMRRDDVKATEAAVKYFVLGALSSGMLLYGMSMVYGATGQLEIPEIAKSLAFNDHLGGNILVFGLVFVVAGVAFKLGVAPFHMWLPDVYHGAPSAVTLIIGSAPKVAAFAFAVRMLVEAFPELSEHWVPMAAILAVLSLLIGNVAAIAQKNLKRMLAYSGIAHMGFLLLGLSAGSADGYAASTFYVVTYALMSLAGFGMIVLLSRDGFEAENLDDLKGLARRDGFCAGLVLLLMFSMAGVPPVIGFYAKLTVLQAVVDSGALWLAIVAVLLSVVGAFYYLRVVKLMFFDKPSTLSGFSFGIGARVLAGINGFLILWLGLFPDELLKLCRRVVEMSL